VTEAATPDVPCVIPAPEALAFLERAGALLAGSLDLEETLRRVAQLAVPDLADWCGVLIRGDDGDTRELTSGHPDPEQEALLVEMRRRRRERDGASESVRVIETGRPIVVTDVRAQHLDDGDVEPDERDLLERMGPRSYMLVPLVARGRVLGALTLLSTREGRHYGRADAAFAEQLAGRCALAIDNAQLYAEAERSLALLDAVFATAPVGLAFLDAEQRFVRVNEALAAINGRPVAEHLGRTIEEVLGPFGAELAAVHRRVMAEGRQVIDEDVRGQTPAACAPRSWRRPARCSTPRWTTRRRCATWRRSPSRVSRTGAASASWTTRAFCARWPPRTSTPRRSPWPRSSTAASPCRPTPAAGRRTWRARASPR
jgi:GAF domain-containing protein